MNVRTKRPDDVTKLIDAAYKRGLAKGRPKAGFPKPGTLNARQTKFIEEYCIDRNSVAAARRSGYTEKAARSHGNRLLHTPHIAAEIKKRLDVIEEKAGLKAVEAMMEVKAIATSNITDGMEINKVTGTFDFKDPDTIPPDFWKAAQEVSTFPLPGGGVGIKIKMHPKLTALKMEYDRHQLVQPAVNQTTNIASMHISLLDQNKAMKRVGESEIIDV